jgi:ABC-type polysaccharide/polyol phosphate transport system ATPase subunit
LRTTYDDVTSASSGDESPNSKRSRRPLAAFDSEAAISVADVTVRYRMPTERINTLKERVVRGITRRSVGYTEFTALSHINLQVKRGEAIALIGRNGAGKSTLLKVIARVQQPTLGRVWVRGQVAPMIELGAGFHPELTGRENVFLNGAMLGFSQQQMQKKFDDIIAFSELESFIDSPLRTYSSGMQARLGFAVASSVEPDILIIDEVLAVGDEAFQQKCVQRMKAIRALGTTLLYVTHAVDKIGELCDKAALIDEGRLLYCGDVDKAVAYYRERLQDSNMNISSQRRIAMVVRKRG